MNARRASVVLVEVRPPALRGESDRAYLYRCDECRALLLDGEDARAHLRWHDTLAPS